MVLQTKEALRLEALVREGLIRKMNPGRSFEVYINALDRSMEGKVEEVIPSADPKTRTFLVKLSLPPQNDLFPGMFGRLLIPIMEKDVVVAPYSAIRRIGQLEVVTVKENGEWKEIFVKTGRRLSAEKVEVLSGLMGDEILAISGGQDV
jgi:multidrug efflux pump subunit AcrA (membrane-fusion protein)